MEQGFVCVEETRIFDCFNSFGVTLLRESLKTLGSSPVDKEVKEELIKHLRRDLVDLGIEEIICQLQRNTTEEICDFYQVSQAPIDDEGDYSFHQSEKYWKDSIQSSSLLESITALPDSLVQAILFDLGIKIQDTLALNRKLLYTEIILTGVEAYLTLLTQILLKKYCTHLEISTNGKKQELIERIIQSMIKNESKDEKHGVSETSKHHIEDDRNDILITRILNGEIQLQKLLVKDLRSFCTMYQLNSDGKKSQLIKTIQDFTQNKENVLSNL